MDKDVAAAAAMTLCAMAYYNYVCLKIQCKMRKNKKWRRRRFWMSRLHLSRTCEPMERESSLLSNESPEEFAKFHGLSQSDFEYLLNEVSPMIAKQDTILRQAIPARTRLAITLRYLATGDSFESFHLLFKVSSQSISNFIPEVCEALNKVLKEEIETPTSTKEWLEIEKGFAHKFPRAIGLIDEKQIVCATQKKTNIIVLLTLIDSNYNFIFADIGFQDKLGDDRVFRNSSSEKNFIDRLNLPTPHPLPNSNKNVPYVLLGDGGFVLTEHVMIPYRGNHDWGSPKYKFNQRLTNARLVVENTFGILVKKFKIFKRTIQLNPEKVKLVTMTCILLHNFLRKSATSSYIYSPPGTVDICDENNKLITLGSWRSETSTTCAIRDMPHIPRQTARTAREVRDEFTNYFLNN